MAMSDDLYLLVSKSENSSIAFYDLFPTQLDAIKSIKKKLTGIKTESGKLEPVWETSELKVYKTYKNKFHEDFDTIFGDPEEEDDCNSWFDIYVHPKFIESPDIEELDLGRFLLENIEVK